MQASEVAVQAKDEELLLPEFYGMNGYPYATWERLRDEDPVHYVEDWAGDPFWAVTRYHDIVEISKHPEIFSNAPRFTIDAKKGLTEIPFRSILDMDPPEHRTYRSLVSRRFTPKALERLQSQVQRICDEVIEGAATGGEEAAIDFVDKISARLPIWVIAEMIGAPREDWEDLYMWTNIGVGATDPEYQQGRTFEETRTAAIMDMFEYFKKMVEDRRQNPRDDIASDLANAQIEGGPLPELELLTYYNVLLSAGNETTRNATTGGLMLLLENPDQFERLRNDLSLLDSFVEELLRMVSPVIHMCRTPHKDVEFRGKLIKAETPMALFFPSANRDERAFEEPNAFRVDRDPNHHLAFGIGEHFCLGTHVARMELRGIFERLVQRMDDVQLAGEPDRLHQNVVGGIKRLPIRYRLKDAV